MKTNSWKTADLAGCEVFTENGERLGIMKDVLPSGANDIWVVEGDTPRLRELLIPALRSVVLDVDTVRKKIVVALPPGLQVIYESDETR